MSRGVLYLKWGNFDQFLERSIASLRRWHPDLPYHVHELAADSTYLDKTRMYELSPFDTTAYLDADTVVMGNLDYAFDRAEKHGLACCINEVPWRRRYQCFDTDDGIEYNAGVMFFDKMRFAKTAKAWVACAREIDSSCHFNTNQQLMRQPVNDQAGLTMAFDATNFQPHVLPLNWNYRPRWQKTFCGNIKIWHGYEDPPQLLLEKSRAAEHARVLDFVQLEDSQPEPEENQKRLKIACAMSVPRLGYMDNFFCWVKGLRPFGICPDYYMGVFWGQCLERVMEQHLSADYILTVDYDTVFCKEDVQRLLALAATYPEADAIVPIQPRRGSGQPLMTIADDDGNPINEIAPEAWQKPLLRITTGHFGLTLIKTSALKQTEHPWFLGVPNKDGRWGDGKVDDDMYFWKKWHRDGRKVYLATQVAIGHMEMMVAWTKDNGEEFGVQHQYMTDYNHGGKPEGVW